MPIASGQTLKDRYRIERTLAQGRIVTVYRAHDARLDVPVAIKENLDASPDARSNFEREAPLLASLAHPNLPRVTDYFFTAGQGQYLVMDWVEGETCQSQLDRWGKLDERQVLEWGIQICAALSCLHNQATPIIHGDIKPANITIRADGSAVLMNIGIGRVYASYLVLTIGDQSLAPGYSAPEQYGGGKPEARSDIYALGATLYHLLTGARLPEGKQRAAGGAPVTPLRQLNSRLSPAAEQAILKAIDPSVAQRFQRVEELCDALAQALDENNSQAIGTLSGAAHVPSTLLRSAQDARRVEDKPAPPVEEKPVSKFAPALPDKKPVTPPVSIPPEKIVQPEPPVAPPPEKPVTPPVSIPPEKIVQPEPPVAPPPEKPVIPPVITLPVEKVSQPSIEPARPGFNALKIMLIVWSVIAVSCLVCCVGCWGFLATLPPVTPTGTPGPMAATLPALAAPTRSAAAMATLEARPTSTPRPRTGTAESALKSAYDWPHVLYEIFNYNTLSWPAGVGENELGVYTLTVNYQYTWNVAARDDFFIWVTPNAKSVNDFYLAVKLKETPAGGAGGLIFRQEGNTFYAFLVNGDRYSVALCDKGNWTSLVDWTQTPALKPARQNKLAIIALGTHYVFFANDLLVEELDHSRLSLGQVGLAAQAPKGEHVRFEFDEFELRAP